MREAKLAAAMLLLTLAIFPATGGVSYYAGLDVPANLGGTDYTPNIIVRSDSAVYSVGVTLPGSGGLAAVHRRSDGLWLLASDEPFLLGSTPVQTHDVVSTSDGTTFVVYFDGTAAGIPNYAGIDTILLDATGNLVVSFNVPVNLGGVEYGASDLVRYSGGTFSLFWNASSAGVPAYANVVGADLDSAGTLVLTFDVPIRLGSSDYLPGQLVRWNGGTAFSSYFVDPAWPPYAQLRDFSFVTAAGAVPGGGTPGTPLTVTRDSTTGDLTLSWGTSCATGDTDYEIYEGTVGSYYSHSEIFCTTGGATTKTFTPAAGGTYYLVVSRNPMGVEGSYGIRSDGTERPQGTTACLPQQVAAACP